MRKIFALWSCTIFLMAVAASSTTRIEQIAPNRFLLTHKKQSALGGSGKALRKVYEKAASLCLAAGYEWFEIKSTASQGRGFYKTASATLDIKLYHEQKNEDVLECKRLADSQEVEKMKVRLAQEGYKPDPSVKELQEIKEPQ